MHQNDIFMGFIIRDAVRSDVADIHRLIKELAVFEEAENEMVLSLEEVAKDGFGDQPLYHCFVAVDSETHKVIGIALTYLRYSTWKGKALHLEDLIVEVEHRGKGIGSALLDHVISYGKSIKVRRIGWEVLDWNKNAIALYESKGAKVLKNWYVVQLENNG